MACGSFNWADASESDREDFLFCKFWNPSCSVKVDEEYRLKLFNEKSVSFQAFHFKGKHDIYYLITVVE